jgi:hypothetical protein
VASEQVRVPVRGLEGLRAVLLGSDHAFGTLDEGGVDYTYTVDVVRYYRHFIGVTVWAGGPSERPRVRARFMASCSQEVHECLCVEVGLSMQNVDWVAADEELVRG